MLEQEKSNKLWGILKTRKDRISSFSVDVQASGIRVETFSVWTRLPNGHREKKRDYYRMVRDKTGTVLYDQLEELVWKEDASLVPDIRLSPNRANKMLSAVLEQQAEIDKLIAEVR